MVLPEGGLIIERIGIGGIQWNDLYHALLTATWSRFLGMIALAYLIANMVFAGLYLLVGGIENLRPGSFQDAFFFSVQTMGTIGYGKMSPVTAAANIAMTVESFFGILAVALTTGLMFAKFARPTARVLWSKIIVVGVRNGVPSLMIRMANERTNQIVEAQIGLTMLMDEVTAEGEILRRLHDLQLMRSTTPMFTFTFTAIHPIVPGSPLHGKTPEQLAKLRPQFFCSLLGIDQTIAATVHARHIYAFDDIKWDSRFVDIIADVDGRRIVDYTKFHDAIAENASNR